MKILIVENEIYLAQSIASKLTDIGYVTEHVTSIVEALNKNSYDAVLLSTNLRGENFYSIIEKYSESIIILMISYISYDTVLAPIKAGAHDYIQKPFMIEDLIRKLENLKIYNKTKNINKGYENYIQHKFALANITHFDKKIKLPFLIIANSQLNADASVFNFAKLKNMPIIFYSFSNISVDELLEIKEQKAILYLIDFQILNKNEKLKIINFIENKNIIITSNDPLDKKYFKHTEVSLINDDENSEIKSVEDYVKSIILKYQSKLPDTVISQKLGMSRKSLWEKRKKYGIEREK